MSLVDDVRRVVADTLNVSENTIDQSSSSETIDAWDSLAQVNLMMAIEQTFDLELEVEDFMKLNSVAAITGYIESQTQA